MVSLTAPARSAAGGGLGVESPHREAGRELASCLPIDAPALPAGCGAGGGDRRLAGWATRLVDRQPASRPLRLAAEVADGRVDCLTFQVSFWERRWSRGGRFACLRFRDLVLNFPFLAAL